MKLLILRDAAHLTQFYISTISINNPTLVNKPVFNSTDLTKIQRKIPKNSYQNY